MSTRKKFEWCAIFLILGLTTFITVDNLFANTQHEAMAMMLEKNQQANLFVALPKQQEDEILKQILEQMLKLFGRLEERLCTINNTQLQRLSEHFDTSVEQMNIKGQQVKVVKIRGGNIKPEEIQQVLMENGHSPECQVTRMKNLFLLIFSAHMS